MRKLEDGDGCHWGASWLFGEDLCLARGGGRAGGGVLCLDFFIT